MPAFTNGSNSNKPPGPPGACLISSPNCSSSCFHRVWVRTKASSPSSPLVRTKVANPSWTLIVASRCTTLCTKWIFKSPLPFAKVYVVGNCWPSANWYLSGTVKFKLTVSPSWPVKVIAWPTCFLWSLVLKSYDWSSTNLTATERSLIGSYST